ncbi:hypothetical protein [Nocardia australiensis]|uniref:hypothetical protein n=1 Tax=Nocardia australiensis TaxID=2887191 RepID=UPI001D15C11F|nr:hypothetical protein [Nocardia australiensis]
MVQFCRAVLLDAGHTLIGYLDACVKLRHRAWIGDDFVQGVERLLSVPTRVVWTGRQEPLYGTAETVGSLVAPQRGFVGQYLINHDKRVYVDKATVLENGDRYRIHPLPVLTAEGPVYGVRLDDGRLSGNTALAGSWARDRISVSPDVPTGFEQLIFDLVAS